MKLNSNVILQMPSLPADEIDQSVTMLRGMNRFIGEKLFNLLLSLVHDKK